MSEKISRRVFLKTTGFAALSVAAAGVLGGCDISPLPGNAVLSTPGAYNTVTSKDLIDGCEIAFSALSDEWESFSTYEADKKPHRYIYVGLYIQSTNRAFELKTSDIKCTIGNVSRKVVGLGNIGLNKEGTAYEFPTALKVPVSTSAIATPVYIDLGESKLSDLISAEVKITVTLFKKTVTAIYQNPTVEPPVPTVEPPVPSVD